jgi:F-type H+-transporting ATPase subunit a
MNMRTTILAGLALLGWLTVSPALAQEHASAPATPTEEHGGGSGDQDDPASILMHHVTDQPVGVLGISSKHLLFFGIVAVLVLIAARMAVASYDKKRVPKGPAALVETIVLFIRDEIAEKNIGHGEGTKYTPLLASFFFFILIAALLGLLPFSATSTGNIAVTAALATVSFFAQQYGGISTHGVVGHFSHLVPAGMPKLLLPIMIPIEILGMFTKPFALMIRLFANMIAGHMVITALLLLIPLMARLSPYLGVAMAPLSLGLSLFIMILEVLVAFIQAYIFTLLTAIFIGMYVHPAH